MDPIPRDRIAEAVEILVRAFDEDPFFRFLAPGRAERAALVGEVMRANLEVAAELGLARGRVNGAVRGVCLWYPPRAYPPPARATLRARGAAVARTLGRWVREGRARPRALTRALRVDALMKEAHPEAPFYYLEVLGVDPRHHGRGHGGALMRAALAEADRDRRIAVLETSKPANLGFYRRYGFEIVQATHLEGGPPVWTMRRAPA
jgi:ribosomal protein S18 acetylase RimI-like enzyme